MHRRAQTLATLRQAFLAWTMVASLLLVWTGTHLRGGNFQAQSAVVNQSVQQTADRVATLSAAAKLHRAPEFQAGGDPDVLFAAAGAGFGRSVLGRDVAACEPDALCGTRHHARPEPRAPPLI